MASAMPLAGQDKQRIREEELYRLKVEDEHRLAQHKAARWKTIVFWLALVAVAVLLQFFMRRGNA
jgi:hypothetical protein